MAPPQSVQDILRGRHARRQMHSSKRSLDQNQPQQTDPETSSSSRDTTALPSSSAAVGSDDGTASGRRPRTASSPSKRSYKTDKLQSSASLKRSAMPEALLDGADKHDDIIATVPNMNHSMLSVLQTIGQTFDFQSRYEDVSTDDEAGKDKAEDARETAMKILEKRLKRKEEQQRRRQGRIDEDDEESGEVPKELLSAGRDDMYGSQILRPSKQVEPDASEDEGTAEEAQAPYLSMMLKGEAEMEASQHLDDADDEEAEPQTPRTSAPTPITTPQLPAATAATLAQRLMEIFKLEKPEVVEAEYPCWLLQTVLLAGHLYITSGHFCFYAYLPKNSSVVAKSGYLGKRGRHNPSYRRYYFELKGDALRYYDDPSKIYTPAGQIDLRFGISATIEPDGRKPKEKSSLFKVETKLRIYWFRADSVWAARDWVKHLQRVIFRSHNDGDSVKVCIPIKNVIDIEDWKFLDALSDTVKIRSIDVSQSGDKDTDSGAGVDAVDEFHFSFFDYDGKEAIGRMRATVAKEAEKMKETGSKKKGVHPRFSEATRTTLFPPSAEPSPHRSSFESDRSGPQERRDSISPGRAKGHQKRISEDRIRKLSKDERSSERSPVEVLQSDQENDTDSSAFDTGTQQDVSASQILSRTDVFTSPTSHRIRHAPALGSDDEDDTPNRFSEDASRQRTSIEARPRPSPIQTSSSAPSSTFQNIVQVGTMPIRGVSNLAGRLKDQSRRMSSRLATESMGYLEKVSGMWHAPVKHYEPIEGMPPDDDAEDEAEGTVTTVEDLERYSQRFRDHFALPESETLVATYFGNFFRVLPLYGKIYISKNYFCFRSLFPGMRTKLVLPLDKIESAAKDSGLRQSYGYYGMVVTIQGHEEIFFEFASLHARDDCTITLILCIEGMRERDGSKTAGLLVEPNLAEKTEASEAMAEYESLRSLATNEGKTQSQLQVEQYKEANKNLTTFVKNAGPDAPTLLFDDPAGSSLLNFKPAKPMRITCLTIGSRGDVQPYIALAKGLMADGHTVKIATHEEFGPWIESHGIEFAAVSGDPGELMKLCIEYGTFTIQFLREASSKFRDWIDDLLMTAWTGCQGSDLLIESPSAMAGIHIAEALRIPYFRAFTMPWTRTRAYPHAFAVPEAKLGGTYNFLTYQMIDVVFWRGIAGAVNRWRVKNLNLGPTTLNALHIHKVPFLYCFSPTVVPPPLDYSDWIRVTGYWFLDEGQDYVPPKELIDFITRAKKDGKKLVYVGFGSILVDDPAAMTRAVVEAVKKADVRCVLAKGWSERVTTTVKSATAEIKDKQSQTEKEEEVEIPDTIIQIKATPHDWLFPQMDCVAHHGGSGTTGASLRAGVPTIAKPFFGDQFFFGRRIEDLGVGICLKKLNSTILGRAMWEATNSDRMIRRARVIGEKIRSEDGVGVAIGALYRDLEYARSLIKRDAAGQRVGLKMRDEGGVVPDEEDEEKWTWVDVIGDDSSASGSGSGTRNVSRMGTKDKSSVML